MDWRRRAEIAVIFLASAMMSNWRAEILISTILAVTGTVFAAQRTNPKEANESASPEARNHYQAGVDLARRQDLSAALRRLDIAISLDALFTKAHDARGVVLAMLGRSKDSEAAFRTAIALD